MSDIINETDGLYTLDLERPAKEVLQYVVASINEDEPEDGCEYEFNVILTDVAGKQYIVSMTAVELNADNLADHGFAEANAEGLELPDNVVEFPS